MMTLLDAEHGFLEVEPHSPQQRRADRQVVLLLHGLGGSKDDWRFPAWRDKHWDHSHPPPDRHSDNHLTPPVQLPEFSLSVMRTDIRCWSGVLKALGHTVINYSQDGPDDTVEVPLAQFEGRIAPFIREHVLTDQLAGKRVAVLCHSRGGILARAYLREHPDASEWIGRVITLCSPHQGTEAPRAKQRLADAAAVLGGSFLGAGTLLVDLVLRITGLLESGDGANQLLPDDPLFDRLADPADVPSIEFTTFGGTSVRYGRIYQWWYTPASHVPNLADFPDLRFDWTQIPVEMKPASPLLDAIPDAVVDDEQDEGKGDGLVADRRSRLPGAAHRPVPVNHAEALWDENLFAQVADLLGTPLSTAGPVECGRVNHTLSIEPSAVSLVPANINGTVTGIVRIRNTTGSTVTIRLAASPPGVFQWDALNATLSDGDETSVKFKFRPVDHAIRTETVRLTSTAPGSPHTIKLLGKQPGGFDPDAEEPLPTSLSLRPPFLEFGSVSINTEATRILKIGNSTGRLLHVTIAASPPGSVFSWPELTTSMGNNIEEQLKVKFKPTSHDLEHGTLTVVSNTAASPDTIKLHGKGPGGFPTEEDQEPEPF
jgi:pimeloyl-ACP methyl ester carboxylesterase